MLLHALHFKHNKFYYSVLFIQISLHFCYDLKGWAECSTKMEFWRGNREWCARLYNQCHTRLVWWGDRIQLRPQQYWPLQVIKNIYIIYNINIVTRAVSIVPCCQDEPRGGSLHPAGLGDHKGAWLRLGGSRGQLISIRAVFSFLSSSNILSLRLLVSCG